MKIVILLCTIWIFVKTLTYGLYEYYENKNKFGSLIIFTIATISLLLPNLVVFLYY